MYIAATDGEDLLKLSDSGIKPVWSPDGTTIAFLDWSQVWLMDPNGENRRSLADPFSILSNIRPEWSPDSRLLSLIEDTNGGIKVFAVETGETIFEHIEQDRSYRDQALPLSGHKVAYIDQHTFVPALFDDYYFPKQYQRLCIADMVTGECLHLRQEHGNILSFDIAR